MTLDTYASLFDGDLDYIAETIDAMNLDEATSSPQDDLNVPDSMALAVV